MFQLREYAQILRSMVEEDSPQEKIQAKIEFCMENIFRIVAICIGIPPKVFTWEYYDKAKQHCIVENMKPIEFYETQVKPFYNVEQKVRYQEWKECVH